MMFIIVLRFAEGDPKYKPAIISLSFGCLWFLISSTFIGYTRWRDWYDWCNWCHDSKVTFFRYILFYSHLIFGLLVAKITLFDQNRCVQIPGLIGTIIGFTALYYYVKLICFEIPSIDFLPELSENTR